MIAEANNGGAMVESVLRAADAANLPVKLVHASRGKVARAEPVAVLYETRPGAHHVGAFPALEDELAGLTDRRPLRRAGPLARSGGCAGVGGACALAHGACAAGAADALKSSPAREGDRSRSECWRGVQPRQVGTRPTRVADPLPHPSDGPPSPLRGEDVRNEKGVFTCDCSDLEGGADHRAAGADAHLRRDRHARLRLRKATGRAGMRRRSALPISAMRWRSARSGSWRRAPAASP